MSTQTGNAATEGDASTRSNASEDGNRRRIAAVAVGGTLLALGVRRRSPVGAAMAAAGGWVLYRGVRGRGRSGESKATAGESTGTVGGEPRVGGPTAVERSITVGESADELYRFWRDADLLNRIVGDFAAVGVAGPDRHRWTVRTPVGPNVEWETEMVEDRPGEFLRWRATEDATIPFEGSVAFRPAPTDRGTEVTLTLSVDPPGGRVGDAAMELLGIVPKSLAGTALDRFKSLAETGEIPTTEGNPSGRGSGDVV